MHGQNDDPDLGELGFDDPGGINTIHDGHAYIHQHNVWSVLFYGLNGSQSIPYLRNDLEVVLFLKIAARDGERLKVEQRGVARWGPFARSFTTVREVELEPMAMVRSHTLSGSLGSLTSMTRFEAVAGGTEVRHHVEWRLDTWLPYFVVEPLLLHEVR